MVERRTDTHDDPPVHRRTTIESGGAGGFGIAVAAVLLIVFLVALYLLFGEAITGTDGTTADRGVETPGLVVPEADAPATNVDTGEPAEPGEPGETETPQ